MFCAHCGHSLEGHARFCAQCGEIVRASASAFDQGRQALKQEGIAQAIPFFERALEETPDDVRVPIALATVYLQQCKFAFAEKYLRRVIAMQPSRALAHALLGSALLSQFRVQDARDELEIALRLDPADIIVRLKRAEFFFRLGFLPDAMRELEAALKLPPSDPAAQLYARQLWLDARTRSRRGFARPSLPFGFAGSRD